jgi:iron complex transport system ATP-binding protein
MALLELIDVSVFKPGSGSERLVDSVSCSVDAGQILSIIGPNGAGKSSLLKALSGEWNHTGKIHSPNLLSSNKLRARQLAVLPQLSLLNFPYAVEEVVLLGRIPHETGMQRDLQIVDAALQLMDIGFLKHRLYTELSGGEKQRVQLARVLTQIWDVADAPKQSRVLIMDEPTSALDLGHQHDLMKAVRSIRDSGVAVIMVMHDINLAARYSDKILALLCSQTVSYGTPQQVITADNIKRLFSVDVEIMNHPKNDSPIVVGL